MKFILHEIKLWFKDKKATSKSYYFLPNKINVITGDSNTGKSSFLNIIDYCLLSDQVKIAMPIIKAVDWFGINFTINNENVFIARRSANNGISSIDVFFGKNSFPEIPYKNSDRQEIQNSLNAAFNITQELKDILNISYRDFLLFNSLTENIIASQELYFDTIYFEQEYPRMDYITKLKTIFNFITGITTLENIKTEKESNEIQEYIKKFEDKKRRNNNNNIKYKNDLIEILDECKKYKLLDESLNFETVDEIIEAIESIIPDINIIDNNNVLKKIDKLNSRKKILQDKLFIIKRYKKELNNYRNNLIKSADSLQPIDFLYDNLSDQIIYPLETQEFLEYLKVSLLDIKEKTNSNNFIPNNIINEITSIQEEIKLIDNEIIQENKKNKNIPLEKNYNCFILGNIKEKLNNIKQFYTRKYVNVKEETLADKKKKNIELLDVLKKISTNKEEKINKLNMSIQFYYSLYNSIPVYKNYVTKFIVEEMSLKLYPSNDMFPIGNLGSKSNFMFMHLYFYLGLHTYLLDNEFSYLPQFLFIDQPSIPYYEGNDDNLKLSHAFNLLNKFIDIVINEKNTDFQIFMVEHAPKENWENTLIHFHTVDEFLNGVALIPQQLIKND